MPTATQSQATPRATIPISDIVPDIQFSESTTAVDRTGSEDEIVVHDSQTLLDIIIVLSVFILLLVCAGGIGLFIFCRKKKGNNEDDLAAQQIDDVPSSKQMTTRKGKEGEGVSGEKEGLTTTQ